MSAPKGQAKQPSEQATEALIRGQPSPMEIAISEAIEEMAMQGVQSHVDAEGNVWLAER